MTRLEQAVAAIKAVAYVSTPRAKGFLVTECCPKAKVDNCHQHRQRHYPVCDDCWNQEVTEND